MSVEKAAPVRPPRDPGWRLRFLARLPHRRRPAEPATEPPPEAPDAPMVVVNQTSDVVIVERAGQPDLRFAPFERRASTPEEIVRYGLDRLEEQFYLETAGPEVPHSRRIRLQVLVYLVSLLIPGVWIFFASDLFHLVITGGGGEADADVATDVAVHVGQIILVALLSALPALLFFLFDRDHVGKLRAEFIRDITRFDPGVSTEREVDAKYGGELTQMFGHRSGAARDLWVDSRGSPVVLATVAIGIGWCLALDPSGQSGTDFASLMTPTPNPLAFGFLGAYVYAVHATLRDYFRRDLWPKLYTLLWARIAVVLVLAAVVETVAAASADSSGILAVAFLAGMLPSTAFFVIERAARATLGVAGRSVFDAPLPLSNLEGIDLADQARLESEGVTNVEALAHADVIALMIRTRIPVRRLVDWTDQAILHLHLQPRGSDAPGDIDRLRAHGVRTATGFLKAAAASSRLTPEELPEGFSRSRMRMLSRVLMLEDWTRYLLHWRHYDDDRSPIRIPAPATGALPPAPAAGRALPAPRPHIVHRRRRSLATALVFLAAIGVGVGAERLREDGSAAAAGSCSIAGTTRNAATGAPLAVVDVAVATSGDGIPEQVTVSDFSGRFRFNCAVLTDRRLAPARAGLAPGNVSLPPPTLALFVRRHGALSPGCNFQFSGVFVPAHGSSKNVRLYVDKCP